MSKEKELLFSVTAKDFDFSYTKGTGKGGQKRNKTETAVHCKHRESGARGYSDATRSQHKNKIDAFTKCIETKEFKAWHRLETNKHMGLLKQAEEEADRQMRFINVEMFKDGKWVPYSEETENEGS